MNARLARHLRPLVVSLALPLSAFALGAFARPSAAQPMPPSQQMCQVTLAVGRVAVRPGCQIDDRVSGQQARLSYPCRGGNALAAFGASIFHGSVDARGEVNVAIETQFPFSDGCTWETKQLIQGNLGRGALSYEYREQAIPGQRGCANGCLGTANVQVAR